MTLIVVGGGGFAKEIIWLARSCGREVVGFLDDAAANGSSLLGCPVLGSITDWINWQDQKFVVAIGDPRSRRQRIVSRCTTKGLTRRSLPKPVLHAQNCLRSGFSG